jgi:hypothetical protein
MVQHKISVKYKYIHPLAQPHNKCLLLFHLGPCLTNPFLALELSRIDLGCKTWHKSISTQMLCTCNSSQLVNSYVCRHVRYTYVCTMMKQITLFFEVDAIPNSIYVNILRHWQVFPIPCLKVRIPSSLQSFIALTLLH